VIANASAALLAAEHASGLSDAVQQVRTAITNGLAAKMLARLIEWTQAVPS
jgi:anthranilate phosphoribosyltransferase